MKTPPQLEFQALAALDALKAGKELDAANAGCAHFATWPGPPRQAARLLAAHANSARGRDVLWLIGVKTDAPIPPRPGRLRVPGAQLSQCDAWLHGLLPSFDGLAPKVQAFAVPCGANGSAPARQVIALHIETTRAPFVVRTSETAARLEVPWWDADTGQSRSAGRHELVKLLVPLHDLPQFEMLEAELTFYRNPHAAGTQKTLHRWTLDGSLYVIPQAEARAMIPFHRCSGGLHIPASTFSSVAQDLSFTADKLSPAVRVTEGAVLVEGLGRLFVYCCGSSTAAEIPWQSPLTAIFDLVPAGAERAAVATARLHPVPPSENNQAGRWKL